MKARKGKRSEPFWPSIVMKKWLNIKPKVKDFSEDEVDTETETESEDEAYANKEDGMHEPLRNKTMFQRSNSKRYSVWHRRGKSETLRMQYINNKEIRVVVGTWNVAGILPPDDLEIDDWLFMQVPADMYILGFQEIVPLNAGNVLGAENKRPISKWEAIIRAALNKSVEHETRPKAKSHSVPPSPSTTDVLVNLEAPPLEVNIVGDKSLEDAELNWPEHSLDTAAPPVPALVTSGYKLRRVLSSSGSLDTSIGRDHCNIDEDGRFSKRRHHSSGNLGIMSTCGLLVHESDQCFGEPDDPLSESTTYKEKEVSTNYSKPRPRYTRIVSKQMVGIYVSVWVRRRLRKHINNLKVCPVGIGLMGYMGNKGSVSVSMSLYQSRLCFVCSHLTSGKKDWAEHRRNSDVFEIIRRTQFSTAFEIDQPQTITGHDQIFWFGDLNHRINLSDEVVRKLVAAKQWDELLIHDKLIKELRSGYIFNGWKEGLIKFAPTYKYEINSDNYVGVNPKGGKKRSPAWCDRILWMGKGIKQAYYKRVELNISDHRPISSMFFVEVEIFDHHKLQKALQKSGVIHQIHHFTSQ